MPIKQKLLDEILKDDKKPEDLSGDNRNSPLIIPAH